MIYIKQHYSGLSVFEQSTSNRTDLFQCIRIVLQQENLHLVSAEMQYMELKQSSSVLKIHYSQHPHSAAS